MLEWNLVRLKRLPKFRDKSNVVVEVDFSVSAQTVRGDLAGIVYGKINFYPHNKDRFIDFYDLTGNDVLEWIWHIVKKDEWEQKAIDRLKELEMGDQSC